MTEIRQILNSSAIELANKLDAQDSGGKNGKIEASVWNEFVKDKGGKTIKGSITIDNAIKSIKTYLLNATNQLGKSVADVAKSWGATGTNADNTNDSATRSTGGNQGNKNTRFSTASIKVTVPPGYMSEEAKSIIENQKQGVKLRESLSKGNTRGITKDNVAQAAITVNFGPNSQNQAKFIFNKLKQRFDEICFEHDSMTESAFVRMQPKQQNNWIHNIAAKIISKEKYIVKDSADDKAYFNKNRAKIQKCFDEANKVLVEAANNKSSLKIIGSVNGYEKQARLPDGRQIRVCYDWDSGEIDKIEINYDHSIDNADNMFIDSIPEDLPEVTYTKHFAASNFDKSNSTDDAYITSGYNFEKLKEIAESIFGKNT